MTTANVHGFPKIVTLGLMAWRKVQALQVP
jgi:hypothetical protein